MYKKQTVFDDCSVILIGETHSHSKEEDEAYQQCVEHRPDVICLERERSGRCSLDDNIPVHRGIISYLEQYETPIEGIDHRDFGDINVPHYEAQLDPSKEHIYNVREKLRQEDEKTFEKVATERERRFVTNIINVIRKYNADCVVAFLGQYHIDETRKGLEEVSP